MVGRREDVVHPFKQGDVIILVNKVGNTHLRHFKEGDEFVVEDHFELRDWRSGGRSWSSFVRTIETGHTGFYSSRFLLKENTIPSPDTPWWEKEDG